ncbi:MAG: hypothetical protein PF482_04410, partial [Desulfobacteraceae bacterium]|nr:hypothetical protein [Desulfobacteraceae bacterium]
DDIDSGTNNDDSVLAGTGTEIDMWAGGVASSADGVTVEALEGSWSGTVEVVFEETETTNAPVEDGFAASDVYVIRLLGFDTGETTVPLKVTVPVTTVDIPTPIDEFAFAIETYNEDTGQWERNDAMAQYNENTNSVTFWANHFSKKRVVYIGDDPNVELQKYLYKSDNDKFYITYFSPVTLNKPSSHLPSADNVWLGSATATNPEVPDYIEDLGKALETALTYQTTKIIKPDGYLLFDDPTHDNLSLPDHAISVDVKKIPAKGDTRLGGPMRINNRLKNWHEMKVVAAHELVHLLGDKYYTGTGARLNRWFYEAIAEFYGTKAAGYTKEAYTTYFSGYFNYLRVSLDASDETSYYAVGDFLYWLEDKMNGHVAAGVVISGYSWDITGLNNLLKEWGSSLGDEYSQYVLDCTMGDHDYRADNIKTSITFYNSTLYKKFRFKQPHLTARYIRINPNVFEDGMLVAESGAHYFGQIPLKTYSYTDKNIPVADIDNNLEKTTEANKPIVVKHFGKKGTDGVQHSVFHQIIINPLIADMTVGGGEYYFDYYILVPPEIKSSSAGEVTWSLPDYGENTIKGFHVYSDGVQLTSNPINNRYYADTRILTTSDVQVTVVDKFDNEWPEVEEEELQPNWELLVDISLDQDGKHLYPAPFEKWIPITVSSDGAVSFDFTFKQHAGLWYTEFYTHRVWGTGTYQNGELEIAGQWESILLTENDDRRLECHVTGNFNESGEIEEGGEFVAAGELSGHASSTETITGLNPLTPPTVSQTDFHPLVWLKDFRPIQ